MVRSCGWKSWLRMLVVLLLPAGGALLPGCDTDLGSLLSDISILPDADSISDEVQAACDGVMTEAEILTSILAARIDRSNGITKADEQATALQNCAVDALLGEVALTDCTGCKNAILDQVFGE